jgi:phospholipid/cholesterol/gamma-HCH transport system substrate-binding protein
MRTRFLAAAVLAMILGSCSFGGRGSQTYRASFARAVQVFPAVKVRVLGVNVGEVVDVRNAGQSVEVTFRVDRGVQLAADVNAAIVPMSLLGERYIQLFPAYQGGAALPPGSTIPVSHTAVPSEPDELLRSLQDYLGGLDPTTVTNFVDSASQVIEGSGTDLNRLIHHGAGVLSTLATKRDDLADIIVELDKLTISLSTRQDALGQLIDNYEAVVGTIAANRSALGGTIDGLNQASLQLASLLGAHLDPLQADVDTLTRAGQTIDRNLDRLALTTKWATSLFSAASRAVDYPHDMLRLGNQGQELGPLILMRLEERLMELCLEFGNGCDNPTFWANHVPTLFCYEPSMCPNAKRGSPSKQMAQALSSIQGLGTGDQDAEVLVQVLLLQAGTDSGYGSGG